MSSWTRPRRLPKGQQEGLLLPTTVAIKLVLGFDSSEAASHNARVSFTDETTEAPHASPSRGGRTWPGPPRQRRSQKRVLLLMRVQGLFQGPRCLPSLPLPVPVCCRDTVKAETVLKADKNPPDSGSEGASSPNA